MWCQFTYLGQAIYRSTEIILNAFPLSTSSFRALYIFLSLSYTSVVRRSETQLFFLLRGGLSHLTFFYRLPSVPSQKGFQQV